VDIEVEEVAVDIEVEEVAVDIEEETLNEKAIRKTDSVKKDTKKKKQFCCHLCGQTTTRSTTLR
jgi:hypothetical protein